MGATPTQQSDPAHQVDGGGIKSSPEEEEGMTSDDDGHLSDKEEGEGDVTGKKKK